MVDSDFQKLDFLSSKSKVSVVIPTYNRVDKLERLLLSIQNSSIPMREIIIIDDASTDPSYIDLLKRHPYVKYFRHKQVQYVGESRNDGITLSEGEYIFMVDDDNTVDTKCIEELVKCVEQSGEIGVVAPVTCYMSAPDRIMYAGSVFSRLTRHTIFLNAAMPYSTVAGKEYDVDGFANSYMFRKSAVRKVYPIPKRILLGGEDGYLQFRIKGYLNMRLVLCGNAKVYHDVRPEEYYNRLSPFKLYYAVRGKITFERDLESPSNLLKFYMFLPAYFLYYLHVVLRTSRWRESLIAILRGFKDGIFQIFKNRY